ncbi:MAG TPA: pantoate--beta-alanine ligase [Propionicimonas sp.]
MTRPSSPARSRTSSPRASIDAECVAVVDPDTFGAVDTIVGPTLIALAARVGSTRLIDNIEVAP